MIPQFSVAGNTEFRTAIGAGRMVAKAILLLFVTIAYGYNVDTLSPIIYSPRSALEDKDSYFGYAVHLYHEPATDVSW